MFEDMDLIQLGEKIPKIKPSDNLYVFVHTFYTSKDPEYTKAITELFHSTKDPILTLDDALILGVTNIGNDNGLKRYESLNPQGPRYFLPNSTHHAMPHIGWDATVDVINLINPDNITIAGCTLQEDDGKYSQCVGTTYNSLTRRLPNTNITIAKNLCHIDDTDLSKAFMYVPLGELMKYFDK